MLTRNDAEKIAQKELRLLEKESSIKLDIMKEETIEFEFGRIKHLYQKSKGSGRIKLAWNYSINLINSTRTYFGANFNCILDFWYTIQFTYPK